MTIEQTSNNQFRFTLSSEESAKIYAALKRGLFLAKEATKTRMLGSSGYEGQIEDALEIFDRPMERIEQAVDMRENLEGYFATHHCD